MTLFARYGCQKALIKRACIDEADSAVVVGGQQEEIQILIIFFKLPETDLIFGHLQAADLAWTLNCVHQIPACARCNCRVKQFI